MQESQSRATGRKQLCNSFNLEVVIWGLLRRAAVNGAQWPFTNLQKLDISYKPLPLLGYDDDIVNAWHLAHCNDASMASVLSRLPHLTHLAARCTHFGGGSRSNLSAWLVQCCAGQADGACVFL